MLYSSTTNHATGMASLRSTIGPFLILAGLSVGILVSTADFMASTTAGLNRATLTYSGIVQSPSASSGQLEPAEPHVSGRPPAREVPQSESFGACLKLMDDNHWLVEWIAYHWFALPLRHLVLYIDPNSVTDPRPILERWRGYMDFHIWNHTFKPVTKEFNTFSPLWSKGVKEHLGPQVMFLEQCTKFYKQMNWTSWVLMTDTDEVCVSSENLCCLLSATADQLTSPFILIPLPCLFSTCSSLPSMIGPAIQLTSSSDRMSHPMLCPVPS